MASFGLLLSVVFLKSLQYISLLQLLASLHCSECSKMAKVLLDITVFPPSADSSSCVCAPIQIYYTPFENSPQATTAGFHQGWRHLERVSRSSRDTRVIELPSDTTAEGLRFMMVQVVRDGEIGCHCWRVENFKVVTSSLEASGVEHVKEESFGNINDAACHTCGQLSTQRIDEKFCSGTSLRGVVTRVFYFDKNDTEFHEDCPEFGGMDLLQSSWSDWRNTTPSGHLCPPGHVGGGSGSQDIGGTAPGDSAPDSKSTTPSAHEDATTAPTQEPFSGSTSSNSAPRLDPTTPSSNITDPATPTPSIVMRPKTAPATSGIQEGAGSSLRELTSTMSVAANYLMPAPSAPGIVQNGFTSLRDLRSTMSISASFVPAPSTAHTQEGTRSSLRDLRQTSATPNSTPEGKHLTPPSHLSATPSPVLSDENSPTSVLRNAINYLEDKVITGRNHYTLMITSLTPLPQITGCDTLGNSTVR